MKMPRTRFAALARGVFVLGLLLAVSTTAALAVAKKPVKHVKPVWRQATNAELAALLPARAPVEKEHIETEMRTSSGITDGKGHFIAGIVLITAGYSADGKYSHYLVVQSPIKIGGTSLAPGEYVFGLHREGDEVNVHLHEALTGKQLATIPATKIPGTSRVESLRIWPPGDKALIQIGRFGIPYELEGD